MLNPKKNEPQIRMVDCGKKLFDLIPKTCFIGESWENSDSTTDGREVDRVGMDAMTEETFNALLETCLNKGKIRDGLLLTIHANFGMRYGDVSKLKFGEIMTADGFRKKVLFSEQKTGKIRNFYINRAVQTAVAVYLSMHPEKTLHDYMIVSESNNKRYETEKYVDENGREKTLRVNGKAVCKLDKDGNKILAPMSHTQEENIIKNTFAEIGVLLKNDSRYKGGEVKYNTHSLRKLYAEKFVSTGETLKEQGKITRDMQMFQYLQADLNHNSLQTTMRYCGKFDREKGIICNHMNLGLEVWENYITEKLT